MKSPNRPGSERWSRTTAFITFRTQNSREWHKAAKAAAKLKAHTQPKPRGFVASLFQARHKSWLKHAIRTSILMSCNPLSALTDFFIGSGEDDDKDKDDNSSGTSSTGRDSSDAALR